MLTVREEGRYSGGRDRVEGRQLTQWTRVIQKTTYWFPAMYELLLWNTPENENRNPFLHGVYRSVWEKLPIRQQKMLWRKIKVQKRSRKRVGMRCSFKSGREVLWLRTWHLNKNWKEVRGGLMQSSGTGISGRRNCMGKGSVSKGNWESPRKEEYGRKVKSKTQWGNRKLGEEFHTSWVK